MFLRSEGGALYLLSLSVLLLLTLTSLVLGAGIELVGITGSSMALSRLSVDTLTFFTSAGSKVNTLHVCVCEMCM